MKRSCMSRKDKKNLIRIAIALALFLTIRIQNMWIVFVLSVPVQALAVFWFILRKGQNNVC